MERLSVVSSVAMVVFSLSAGAVQAAKLEVGADKPYAKVSAAIAAAKDGDLIEIAPGEYVNDWAKIKTPNLTIRGLVVDGKRPQLITRKALIDNGKGIFVAQGANLTVENVELIGARVRDANGCGIMSEARDLTVRHCRFYDCEDGIRGGAGALLVEHCEFDHCGHSAGSVATHSLYISACDKLTFRYNYSHHTLGGHLLKSRAKESWILYNRLTDEDGKGSAVIDLPNGGLAVVVGNILHKGPKGDNNRMVMFGSEGLKYERNELHVASNSMWWDNRRPNEVAFAFVRTKAAAVKGAASQPADKDVKTVIQNNVCIGVIPLTNYTKAESAGNLVFKTVAEAGWTDPAKFDFTPKTGSPCIDAGAEPGTVDSFSLRPELEYVFPLDSRKRPSNARLDVGAFEAGSR